MNLDVVVIGTGISVSVIAERIVNIFNEKVLIVKKLDHINGNCYDYKDKNGILIHEDDPPYFS